MKEIMDKDQITRTLKRISHEIIERNKGVENIVLFGIKTRGVYIAKRIQDNILKFEDEKIPLYEIDITPYRDDLDHKVEAENHINIDLSNKKVVLIDDVLYTGRTVRAAMDAIMDIGRPSYIQFVALIDRGHRELPIRADYVGKNIPTSLDEIVEVKLNEIDGIEYVGIK